jgi:type IV secretion system protein VirB9
VAFSKTNMTVLTNAHSYTFQLDSEVQNNKPTYKLQFMYPQESYNQLISTVAFDPEKLNMKYSYTGAKDLVPLSAFDDGTFTYLKFKSEGTALPAVYTVDEKRQESLVNYHMQGNYMVVHTVAKAVTLRNGEKVTMVYNDLAIGDWNKVKGV